MSLQTIEIMMEMEDHFHVQIPDEAFSACVTVADLQRVITDLLLAQGRQQDDELQREVWKGMITVLSKMRYPVEGIRPDSKWIGDVTTYG